MVTVSALLFGCGGGNPAPPASAAVRVSAPTPFGADCNGATQSGTLYPNAEVEPALAVNPSNPANLIGVWQQDRWSSGGAQGVLTAASFDGGQHWTRTAVPFSRCAGGNLGNHGDYARVSDPWVSFAADGTAYQIALSFSGEALQAGSSSAVLLSRSSDGGINWSAPQVLIADGDQAFNDKESLTADRNDARYVYAVWDRLAVDGTGPTYFARSIDGGASWEAAHAIYDPGLNNQTIGNQIVLLPDGGLVDLYTEIDTGANGMLSASLGVLRSHDHGASWSTPVTLAELLATGTFDPQTQAPVRDGSSIAEIAAGADGSLDVVWQDSRFSGGTHDGIALSRSLDGGSSWSMPVRVNGDGAVAAFTPNVHVLGDGRLGVSYYDFRADTADANSLLTDYWLATSREALNWSDTPLAGPFDLDLAPDADGRFLGDYAALADLGQNFLTFFAQTNQDIANRSDIYALQVDTKASKTLALRAASSAAPYTRTTALAQRISDNLARNLERPVPQRGATLRRTDRSRRSVR